MARMIKKFGSGQFSKLSGFAAAGIVAAGLSLGACSSEEPTEDAAGTASASSENTATAESAESSEGTSAVSDKGECSDESGTYRVEGQLDCQEGIALIKDYLERADNGEGEGNIQRIDRDGWHCISPTAADAHADGATAICEKDDAKVLQLIPE